jgi:hypothetical protein
MSWKNFKYSKMRWSPAKIAAAAIGGVLLAVLFAALFGFFVQYLWNWIMPGIFNLREITYWEAFGILVLAKILFGSFAGKGGSGNWNKKKSKDYECCEDPEECKDCEEWEHYDEWWEKEGKASLKKFSDTKKKKIKTPK